MRQEVLWWRDDARYDLETARDLVRLERWNHAVFLSRQACGKMLKAAHLALLGESAAREHNLRTLALALPAEPDDSVLDAVRWLNPHYTPTRYVDAALGPPTALYDRGLAEEALSRAEHVVRWVEGLFPHD